MSKTILITGAAGTLCRDLVPELLHNSDANLVLLVHTTGKGMADDECLSHLYSLPSSTRVRVVSGDITQAGLGLSADCAAYLRGNLTHILHAAADTRFSQPDTTLHRVNVVGTGNVMQFASTCKRLQQVGHISSVYVSGRRNGLIRENELEHDAGFVNDYERSKHDAELLIRNEYCDLPTSIYRLSTIVGDSRTGVVRKMTAPHQAIRLMYMGLAAMMPGTSGFRLDLLPGNYVAASLSKLYLDHFESGITYHLSADLHRMFSLDEVIDTTYRTFQIIDETWARKKYPRPVIAPARTFDLFVESVEQARNPVLSEALKGIGHFAYQLTCPKSFDQNNVLSAIPEYCERQPDIRDYYPAIVEYCLNNMWGRYAA